MAWDSAALPSRLGTMLGGTSDQFVVMSITLMVALLCLCMIIGHLLEENKWMNESITALVLGLCTGTIVLICTRGTNSLLLQFDEELFFNYLLPPIIFNAGFQVKKKQFFRNFVAIVLFGVIGVFISFGVIATGCRLLFPHLHVALGIHDYLALGVIFSATDSVCTLQVLSQDETPLLYSLVFGEGVVNDATSVVLFRAVQNIDLTEMSVFTILEVLGEFVYLYISSTLMGIAVGLVSAYVIKKLYFGRHSTDREIAIMILMAYFSYMLAELLLLSGILTVFFCGIVMSHYTWHNLTESSKITTRHTFATLSFIAETFIFLYVGMDALDIDKWRRTDVSAATSAGLSATLILVVLVGRAAFVFPLSALSNLVRRAPGTKINARQQVIIWWAGLMRGAVSIALAYNNVSSLLLVSCSWTFVLVLKREDTTLVSLPLIKSILQPLDYEAQALLHLDHHLDITADSLFHAKHADWLLTKDALWMQFTGISSVNATMITSTIIVVLFSTVVFGLLTKPLLQWLLPPHLRVCDNSEPNSPKDASFRSDVQVPLLDDAEPEQTDGEESVQISNSRIVEATNSLRMLLRTPTSSTVHHFWRKFDDSYMRPMFGGRGFVPTLPRVASGEVLGENHQL